MDASGVSAHLRGMKAIYLHTAGALAVTFGLAACIPASQPPAPTPPPVAAPAPTPTPAPAPAPTPVVQEQSYANYLDAPPTPGTWFYESEPNETLALFGTDPQNPVFILRCGDGQVGLARVVANRTEQPRAMSVTAETTQRQLSANSVSNRQPLAGAFLDPRDPLLDAMAITKGRIAIGVEGERTLYLPAWVEISRVIEDCR